MECYLELDFQRGQSESLLALRKAVTCIHGEQFNLQLHHVVHREERPDDSVIQKTSHLTVWHTQGLQQDITQR